MKRKLFLGIDLETHLKKMLKKNINKWKDLPIKWYKEESFHINLVYLGWIDENLIVELAEELKKSCTNFPSFEIEFDKIKLDYKNNSEENKPQDAKSVCLEGLESEELKNLQKFLEETLNIHQSDKKSFHPHVILGKTRSKQWSKLENFPEIEKKFPITMDIMNVTLFQARADDNTPDFLPIDVFDLNEKF